MFHPRCRDVNGQLANGILISIGRGCSLNEGIGLKVTDIYQKLENRELLKDVAGVGGENDCRVFLYVDDVSAISTWC